MVLGKKAFLMVALCSAFCTEASANGKTTPLPKKIAPAPVNGHITKSQSSHKITSQSAVAHKSVVKLQDNIKIAKVSPVKSLSQSKQVLTNAKSSLTSPKNPIFQAVPLKLLNEERLPKTVVATPLNLKPVEASVTTAPETEPIYAINQRFARVPIEFCPAVSNGYGFEVTYPAANAAGVPVIRRVYGNAYVAGLEEGAQLLTLNDKNVRTQAEFNTIAYQGRARQSSNLVEKMTIGVLQNGIAHSFTLKKSDYCLSNLTLESEYNILRMDFNTKGSGYSVKADARVYVDMAFLNRLTNSERLTLAAVAAGEQYRQGLRIKRGKTGLFIGQVFGTIVTLFTGLPVTDLTASSASAVGMKDRREGALRPAVSYAYYLALQPEDMRRSLEKLASYRESYKVQGKRYDWPVLDDYLSEFEQANSELEQRVAQQEKNLMLEPKISVLKKSMQAQNNQDAEFETPISEQSAGVVSY